MGCHVGERLQQQRKLRCKINLQLTFTPNPFADCLCLQEFLENEEELAVLDPDTILAKQVEQLEREKKELQAKLKAQEKKVDHFVRACHQVRALLIFEVSISMSFLLLSGRRFVTRMISLWVFLHFCVGHRHTN